MSRSLLCSNNFGCLLFALMYFEQPRQCVGVIFYIHGSVHRNSILKNPTRYNNMQVFIYLLQNYSTCFGCQSHPSSGVHKTVTAASGTVLCTPDDGCDGHPKHVE